MLHYLAGVGTTSGYIRLAPPIATSIPWRDSNPSDRIQELIEYYKLTCFNTAFTYMSLDLITSLSLWTLPKALHCMLRNCWPCCQIIRALCGLTLTFLFPSQSLGSGQNDLLLGSSNVMDSSIFLLISFPFLRMCFLDFFYLSDKAYPRFSSNAPPLYCLPYS